MADVQRNLFANTPDLSPVDLSLGMKLRDEGKDQVEENSDGFVAAVRQELQKLSLRIGEVTNDDARRVALQLGIAPKNKNAWGAIFRGKGWRQVGWKPSAVASNHGHANRCWRYEKPAN